ncbi:hypothetical protein ANN_18587 [Periplaneta americana]|uniref:Uncharacterized protein n=1 Tax=Periplaneta americana TaxID=6978 RepID=A0ABQ8SQ73_PERAM|nr:hypothetical protein ANN_18587 [Periplaneta americana]
MVYLTTLATAEFISASPVCRNFVPQEFLHASKSTDMSLSHLNTLNAIDLGRDRTCNLEHTRPVLYQLKLVGRKRMLNVYRCSESVLFRYWICLSYWKVTFSHFITLLTLPQQNILCCIEAGIVLVGTISRIDSSSSSLLDEVCTIYHCCRVYCYRRNERNDRFPKSDLVPWRSQLLGVQFKVCHGSLYAVIWLVDEPREFNLPTLLQRCITYVSEKLPSKYGVHSEEYGNADSGRNVNCLETCTECRGTGNFVHILEDLDMVGKGQLLAIDDQFLRLQVLCNCHITAVEARNRLEQVRGVNFNGLSVIPTTPLHSNAEVMKNRTFTSMFPVTFRASKGDTCNLKQ